MRRTLLGILIAMLVSAGSGSATEPPPHLEDAIRAQQRRVRANPNNSGALNDLGNLLILAGKPGPAEEAYRRSLEIQPEDATARYNLGLLLRQTGRPKAALRQLKRVVKLDATDAWGHYQLGVLLEESAKTSKAVHHFAQAFLLEPDLERLEVNPQLLDSRLVSRARTLAYTERVARLESAPRQYRQPQRITRLLVPETRPKPRDVDGTGTEPGQPGAETSVEDAAGQPPVEADAQPRRPRRRKPKDDSSDNP